MKFIVIGSKSAFTYKSVFPLIRERRMRLGARPMGVEMLFELTPEDEAAAQALGCGAAYKREDGRWLGSTACCWVTNLRHNVRRSLPSLKTMAENLATNKRLRKHLLEKYGRLEYPRYDNYAAIEVPFVDAIPSDYDGVMGVPVTFLDKWDPDGGAHEVFGITLGNTIEPGPERIYSGAVQHNADGSVQPGGKVNTHANVRIDGHPAGCWYSADGVDGALLSIYARLLIRPAKEIRP